MGPASFGVLVMLFALLSISAGLVVGLVVCLGLEGR